MKFQGNGASLEIEGGMITIARRGVASFFNHGLKGEKRIPVASVSAVQFKGSGMTTGYLQLSLLGGVESRGGVMAAVKDENTVTFTKKQEPEFQTARRMIEEAIAARSAPGSSASRGVADELGKLAALRDQGVLTESEFQSQKARLLDACA